MQLSAGLILSFTYPWGAVGNHGVKKEISLFLAYPFIFSSYISIRCNKNAKIFLHAVSPPD